jgi:hypothetical protein
MIVPAMNNQEIANEIAKDQNMVLTKGIYLTNSLRRKAIKSKNKYARGIFEYRSKNYNNWLILSEYFKKEQVFVAIAYYIDQFGFNAIMTHADQVSLTHFTPHFLSRFNKRFLKQPNLSKSEILKIFLEKNAYGFVEYLPSTYGMENGIFIKYEDGIGLGFYEDFKGSIQRIYHIKTFITDDMTKGNQEDYLDQMTTLHKAYTMEIYSHQRRRFVA